MGFSDEWESIYRQGAQDSVWPWTDLVAYVMRYCRPDRDPFRVLELGFGAGANIPFLLSLGVKYCGAEGSETAVENARQRFPAQERFEVACCDFTTEIPFEGPFNLVVDRGSLTHNSTAAIQACLGILHSIMRPGGRFIGIDWMSTSHSEFPSGTDEEDHFTRIDFPEGQFHGVGTVHFANKTHLVDLFDRAGFPLVHLQHKTVTTEIPDTQHTYAAWNLVAERK